MYLSRTKNNKLYRQDSHLFCCLVLLFQSLFIYHCRYLSVYDLDEQQHRHHHDKQTMIMLEISMLINCYHQSNSYTDNIPYKTLKSI